MRGSKAAIALAAFTLLAIGTWMFIPAAQGFHIGYNSATDGQCLSRLFDWCKPGEPTRAAPVDATGSAPAVQAPVTTTAAPEPTHCARGFTLSSGNRCVDDRHLPCPSGYIGWQNSQIDNCLAKTE